MEADAAAPKASRLAGDDRIAFVWSLAAVLVGVSLVQLGLVDALYSPTVPGRLGWQLDELLFLLLLGLTGALMADRRARRSALDQARRLAARERAHWELALRDSLTGLFNRRGLEELAKAPAAGFGWLFMVDLDGFKGVNDRYGHAVGDEALRQFAKRLQAIGIEGGEVVSARLGGDEFVVLLGEADDRAAAGIGSRIVEQLALRSAAQEPIRIGVSAGLARWLPNMSFDEVMEQADVAMYDAKRSAGGVCRFGPTSENSQLWQGRAERVFERKLSCSPGAGTMCAAAICLDRYHSARRALGYDFAARLMRAVQERLERHHPALLVERLGPDTLAILYPAEDEASGLAALASLRALATSPYALDGVEVDGALTIGFAGPASASLLREMVEQAQSALDEALRSRQPQAVFDRGAQQRAASNLRLMADLREALTGHGLDLYYQPKMLARGGEIDSVEALVRWTHPVRGAISPAEFVPIAEESGDIERLTWWVLDRAISDWRTLSERGVARPIYVNVSAQLIGDPAFSERLIALLADKAGRIGIEITETAVLDRPDQALRHLQRLADAGVSIAIDDYGVGLSSLSYLKQLPASELKIDKLFVSDLGASHRDPMIVRSTIDLAHGLGLRVTAEGVDRPETLALLKIMNCDLIQGHQVAAAIPIQALGDFIEGHRASDKSSLNLDELVAIYA